MRIICVSPVFQDEPKEDRLEKMAALLDRVGSADLCVLPEMWPVGYFKYDRYETDAEPLEGKFLKFLQERARRLGGYLLGGSFPERRHDGIYNAAPFLSPKGELLAVYRKIHLFSYKSEEKIRLRPGREIVTVPTLFGRMGISICYDLRFPELYRKQVADGATFFLVAGAWPAARPEPWGFLLRARAAENQSFVVAANSQGVSNGEPLLGHSAIVDPKGDVLAFAEPMEEIVEASVDPEEAEHFRAEFPALSDRVLG